MFILNLVFLTCEDKFPGVMKIIYIRTRISDGYADLRNRKLSEYAAVVYVYDSYRYFS